MSDKILEIIGLKTYFSTPHGVIKAVDDVSFGIEKGSVFGIVGESGSGKTLTALSILKLVPYPGRILNGEIMFNGIDILNRDEDFLRSIRGSRISVVFQEPASALDPVFTIGGQMVESVMAHRQLKDRTKIRKTVLEYLAKVHIPDPKKVFYDYPHQLSGGTKQRVMIAMALINSPELIILDEPTTALDVTIQSQILDLLDEIIDKEGLSVMFISHDFGIISRMCDHVAVMRKGRIVEAGLKNDVLDNPKDAYTVTLLESVKALS